jgi:DNA-binding NtrC family response regulator
MARKSARAHLLVVDDDETARRLLEEILVEEGYQVDAAVSGQDAIHKVEATGYDLVITDLKMSDIDGLEVLKDCRKSCPETSVIMITAFGSIGSAIEAMKAGAFDYISKPFREDEIKIVVARALEQQQLLTDNQRYRQELTKAFGLDGVVGRSRIMMDVYKTVAMVANSRSTALIQGETGTGKELIARAIHYNGVRASKPFVVLNCAALPEHLLESELFGHVKGAFTGAVTSKRGLFEEAEGGTLFLDEIGDLGIGLQAKVLRMVQEREVRRVGGTELIRGDVRILAATNQPLEARMRDGLFREDLYYRLCVVKILLPALRERRDDIPLLVDYFLRRFREDTGKNVLGVHPEAMDILCRYEWPGNIRELQHAVEHAVVLTTNTVIVPHDLPEAVRSSAETAVDGLPAFPMIGLEELERRYLARVLHATGGNRSEAARVLGVDRRTLYRMAKRFGFDLGTYDREPADSPSSLP